MCDAFLSLFSVYNQTVDENVNSTRYPEFSRRIINFYLHQKGAPIKMGETSSVVQW